LHDSRVNAKFSHDRNVNAPWPDVATARLTLPN
jgi:hypothetical protein